MDSQKGIAPIIVILIVITLLGAGIGGFVVVSKQKDKVESPPDKAVIHPVPLQEETPSLPEKALSSPLPEPKRSSEASHAPSVSVSKPVMAPPPPILTVRPSVSDLQGFWKPERFFEYEDGRWVEQTLEQKGGLTYPEFKGGKVCLEKAQPEGGPGGVVFCQASDYDPFILETIADGKAVLTTQVAARPYHPGYSIDWGGN